MQSDETSQINRDGIASNLYLHMVEEIVTRLLFHNPIVMDLESVVIDLATRKAALSKSNSKNEEYERFGYVGQVHGKNTERNNTLFYDVSNADIYRTVIQREMMLTDKTDLDIKSLQVRPIIYDTDAEEMEFLYLSDMICSLFRREVTDRSKSNQWLFSIDNLSELITGHKDNYVFGYDIVDEYYVKAWNAYETGDYYKALKNVLSGEKCPSEFCKYYARWFSLIKSKIINFGKSYYIRNSISILLDSAFKNNLNQEELLYIFNELKKASETISDPELLYNLYDIGVSAFNHMGNPDRAIECFDKCSEYSESVGLERYIRTCNKEIVAKCDQFDFSYALSLSDRNIAQQSALDLLKHQIWEKENNGIKSPALGRCYSQKAQILSFLNSMEAEALFVDSLSQFDLSSADYRITQSYYMHYLIEAGHIEEYERLALDYFEGHSDNVDIFRYIVNESVKQNDPRFSMKFALYLYIKALYRFYSNEVDKSDDLKEIIKNIDGAITDISKEAKKEINGHPWEIIYKYTALLCIDIGEETIAKSYIEKTAGFIPNRGFTIKAIIHYGTIEYCEKKHDLEEAGQHTDRLYEEMIHSVEAFRSEEKTISTLEEKRAKLDKYFTYMYH